MSATNLRAAIAKAFERIGSTNGTKMLEGATNNADPIAHELFVAKLLESLARGRAQRAAEQAAMLFDENVPGIGTLVLVNSDHYVLQLKVSEGRASASGGPPKTKFNVAEFVKALHKAGVEEDVIARAVSAASSPATPTKAWEADVKG